MTAKKNRGRAVKMKTEYTCQKKGTKLWLELQQKKKDALLRSRQNPQSAVVYPGNLFCQDQKKSPTFTSSRTTLPLTICGLQFQCFNFSPPHYKQY